MKHLYSKSTLLGPFYNMTWAHMGTTQALTGRQGHPQQPSPGVGTLGICSPA